MKALGYFALILSVMYMLACQGSGGGGGSTTKDAAANLTDQNGNAYFTKPLTYGGLSTDIVKGRIVYKQFTTAYGQGTYKITEDSCAPANKDHTDKFQITGRINVSNSGMQNAQQAQPQQMQQQYNPQMMQQQNPYNMQMNQQYPYNQQMMGQQQYNPQMQQQQQYQMQLQQQQYQQTMYQQQQQMEARSTGRLFKPSNMEFNFDGNGVLLVRITDYAGVRTSQPILPVISGTNGGFPPPNSYVLVPPSTVIIGSFSVSGTPDMDYVRELLNSRGLVKHSYDAYDSNYKYSQSSYAANGGQKGFRVDYEAGQNPNMPAPVAQVSTQSGSNSAPTSAATATFEPMVLNALTADGINNNHIYQLDLAKKLKQHSNTLAVDPALNVKSCFFNMDETLNQLTLVKAN